MKRLCLFSSMLLVSVAAGACDKGDKAGKSESSAAPAAKVAEAEAQPSPSPSPSPSPTPTPTTVAKVSETAKETDGPACGGAAGKESGMDCMKKTVEGDKEGGGCNQWDDAADKISKRELPDGSIWTVLNVTGMTCGGCERRIIANVGKIEGVVGVEADSELGKVRVAVAKGNTTAQETAKKKISELGYTVL